MTLIVVISPAAEIVIVAIDSDWLVCSASSIDWFASSFSKTRTASGFAGQVAGWAWLPESPAGRVSIQSGSPVTEASRPAEATLSVRTDGTSNPTEKVSGAARGGATPRGPGGVVAHASRTLAAAMMHAITTACVRTGVGYGQARAGEPIWSFDDQAPQTNHRDHAGYL